MDKRTLALAALSVMAACACASRTPYYDSRFGEAVATARAMQTINPDASRNTDPVTGLDGQSTKDSIDRYHDSFKAPAQTFDIINSGGR